MPTWATTPPTTSARWRSCPMRHHRGRRDRRTPTSPATPATAKLFQGASLDHSVWFERPTDPSQWHWFATQSHGVNRGRGLVTGDVIRHDGLQVATIAQEVLVRRRRDA